MKFVNFSIAKKLKEKGFPQSPDYFNYSSYYDWDGLRKIHSLSNASVWFDPNISRDNIYFAPIISQVLEWLRVEKGIYVTVDVEREDWFEYKIVQLIKNTRCTGNHVYETYNDAILAGIEYVLDNLIT